MTELRRVRLVEHLEIPMADGVRIAGKLWLPEDAAARPVPAILEMVPYRKRDGTVFRDVRIHPWIAARGYACLRIDLRGSGESEGVLVDEYLAQEQQDGLALIDWAARQPWCSGAVGMTGISWGGFNALQLAALRPPALRAIVTLCSTDDRYADDIHWMGGCLINENPAWSADRFTWKMIKADATSFADLSDPINSADYALCLYAGSTGALVMEMGIPPGPKWTVLGASKGYKYDDPPAVEDGAQKLTLKAADTDKAKLIVRGRGVSLGDPLINPALALPVTAQLNNLATGVCWETSFASSLRNTPNSFKAKQ